MKKVLVVDDDCNVRQTLIFWCSASGYEAIEADNGQVALELAQRHLPDLIISDVWMPIMDGYAMLTALRKDPDASKIPVIFISAQSPPAWATVKPEAFLLKPFSLSELAAIAQVYVNGQRPCWDSIAARSKG